MCCVEGDTSRELSVGELLERANRDRSEFFSTNYSVTWPCCTRCSDLQMITGLACKISMAKLYGGLTNVH